MAVFCVGMRWRWRSVDGRAGGERREDRLGGPAAGRWSRLLRMIHAPDFSKDRAGALIPLMSGRYIPKNTGNKGWTAPDF
jgi:hypothetical protein